MLLVLLVCNNGLLAEEPIIDGQLQWTKWPQKRKVVNQRFGSVLSDIESHMKPGHHFAFPSMLMTWAHETTHGINGEIRTHYYSNKPVKAGFYCLDDKCVLIEEPKTKMSRFASKIPSALRGPSYDLYLRQQLRYHENSPLYVLDEWVAYTNGTMCGQELKVDNWYYELLQANNFIVYSLYMAKQVEEDCADYDSTQLKMFIKWNIERVANLTKNAVEDKTNKIDRTRKYLEVLRTDQQGEVIRSFARQYFSDVWCEEVLGF